jgi:excinuclease UvrABC helicase subunit UvrB
MFGNRKNFNLNFDELIAQYEKMMGDLHKNGWSQESHESPDGSYKVTSYVKIFDSSDFDKSKQMSKEEYLKTKLDRAIETEDFESAVKLRDKIKNLENNSEKIKNLESELKISIKEQNFENAIKLRDELKKLK